MYKNVLNNIAAFAILLFAIIASQAAFAVPVSPQMEIHVVPNVGGTPVTINLDNTYTNAIPVCTYNIAASNVVTNPSSPAVVRINSISSTSISIKLGVLDDAPGAFATPGNVHCVIVEEGLWDINGIPIEARKVLSTDLVGRNQSPAWTTGNNNGWSDGLEDVTSLITHPFASPVVLGQVITSNDPLASVYYANNCSNDRRAIPFSGGGGICVGRHISKETSPRAAEEVGIIIAGTTTSTGASGSTGGFRAGTTDRTIRGVDGPTPYTVSTVESYSVAILSQLGERGGDGAWAVLYGDNPLANNTLSLAIEESLINSNNRYHTTEQVNYLVVTVPTITLKKVVDNTGGGTLTEDDFTLSFSGAANNSGVSGSANVTSFPVLPGTFILSENNLAQYTQTGLTCSGGVLNGNELQLSAFDFATCTFTNKYDPVAPTGVDVSGNVFEDKDSNNVKDNSEEWANGVSVFVNILEAGVVVQSVQVNPGTGDFTFPEVSAGTYDLIVTDSQVNVLPVSPSGWVFNSPASGSQTVTVAGSNLTGQNFAVFHAPVLGVSKSTSTATVVNTATGTIADYKITLTNSATLGGDAEGVQISDVLPAGFTYNSASTAFSTAATGNCLTPASRASVVDPADGASGTITWGDWTVPAGCTVVIDFSVNIPSTVASQSYNNSVSVTTTTSPVFINNYDGTLANDENVEVTSAELIVTKESLIKTATAGGTATYQVTVSNVGSATATGVEITDTLPQLNGHFTYSSTTSITGIHTRTVVSNPTVGSTLPVWGAFDIPASGSVILEFLVDVDAAAVDGVYHNSASVTSANAISVTNYDGALPSNDTDNINTAAAAPSTDLSITNTDGLTSAIPGNAISYDIVVTNTGINVVGASVTNVFDPAIFDVANVTWSCSIASGTGNCATPGPATGDINTTVDLSAGSTAMFNVTSAPIRSSATGAFSNNAAVAPPVGVIDSDASNNSALDDNTLLVPTGDLVITKDDGVSSVPAGGDAIYTINVSNDGPSDMFGASVADTFDGANVNVQNVVWSCVLDAGSVGACGAASGTGNVDLLVDLTAGSSITITAIVPVFEAATSPLVNTATVTEPGDYVESNSDNNSAVDSNAITLPEADLEITTVTSDGAPIPGDNFTYTVSLFNNGPSGATNVVVTDTFSSDQINFVSAVASQGAGDTRTVQTISPTVKTWTIPFLPAGNTATLVITANISTSGIHTNTAEVTSLDQNDPDSPTDNGNLTEDDMDSIDVNAGGTIISADLRISKTDGVVSAIPGSTVTYTIVVTNDAASSDDVVGALVEDIFDPAVFDVANVSWTCAMTTGSGACGSPGPVLGNISNTTTVDLTVGSSATFIVTAPILANATGTLSNTATVSAPAGVTELSDPNNTAVDINTVLAPEADLSVTTTVNDETPNAGDVIFFTIEASNAGPSDATNVSIRDILPSGYTFDLAGTTATQGSYDVATGDWTVGTLMASGPPHTLTLSAVVEADGIYLNRAQVWASDAVDPDSTPANNVNAEDDTDDAVVTLPPEVDLTITKTDGLTSATPGTAISYIITVTNDASGDLDVVDLTVEDIFDPAIFDVSAVAWSCQNPTSAGLCDVPTSYYGDISEQIDLLIGASATFSVSAPVLPGATGVISNTATVIAPAGITDSDLTNNVQIDENTMLVPEADLSITTTASNEAPNVGEVVTFTIDITSVGPSDATNVSVRNILPSGLTFNVAGTSATQGSYDVATGDWTVGTLLASSTVQTLTLAATVESTGTYINRTEIWTSDALDTDSTPGNDVITEDDTNEVEIIPVFGYTVSGQVFDDRDVSGLFSAGDIGISNVGVVLQDLVAGTCIATRTNGDGSYAFKTVLDGNYTLYESASTIGDVPSSCPPVMQDASGYLSVTANNIVLTVAGAEVTGQNFANVRQPELTTDNNATGEPGGAVVHSHIFKAWATGSVDFTTSGTPATGDWSTIIYRDISCDARLDTSDPALSGSVAVAADESVCLLVKVFIAGSVSSEIRHVSTLTASYTFADPLSLGHGLSFNRQRQDITTSTVPLNGKLELYKTVQNVDEAGVESLSNSADPGQVLRYKVTFENTGAGSITEVQINDLTPAFTSISTPVICPVTLPASLSNCTVQLPRPIDNIIGYEGPVEWVFDGTLAAGAKGELSFDVVVE